MATVEEARAGRALALARRTLPIAVAGLSLGVLFWDAFLNLWKRWGEQLELSHSYFIPLISAWLVWANRKAVVASIGAPSAFGLLLFAAAGLLLFLGKITYIFLFQHLGLVVAIAGLVAAFGGLSLLRAVAAPVLFLFFAVPPPYWAITVLSWNFQAMSSVLGVAMLQALHVPVYLSGNVIDLGEYKLQVAEACSGLRYLFPFLSLGVMTAYLYRGALWGKLVIVLSTIPITVLMNSVRIAVAGALVQAYGPAQAEGALHWFEGWVVFLLCLIALFGVVALLGLFERPRRNPLHALGAPTLATVKPTAGGIARSIALGGAAAATAVFFGLSAYVSTDALIIPARDRFAAVPGDFPEFRIELLPIEPEVAEVLGADDSILLNLAASDGGFVNLYLAYLNAQRDGRSWHSPRQCIPGGGWQIARHEVIPATTASGVRYHYNRLVIEHRGRRQLVYYWYEQRGRKIANEFVMKFWLIIDAVARKRSDGALVRLLAPISDEEGVAAADRRLQDMAARLEAILPKYAPK